MSSRNKTTLIGRLTKDVEIKESENGNKYIFNTVAISMGYNKEEEKEITEFIPVTIWGNKNSGNSNLDFLVKQGKGALVIIEGRLKHTSKKLEDGSYKNELSNVIERVDALVSNKIKGEDNTSVSELDDDDMPF